MEAFINFVNNNPWVYYIPTILFALIVLLTFLFGLKRGLVKSIHKFVVMLICLSIAIGLYYFLISNNGKNLYLISSKILDLCGTSYENIIGVKPIEDNMYGVLFPVVVDFVANNLGGPEEMALELYYQIQAWPQIAYQFIAFLVCLIIYFILGIILNLIDAIFFGKHKRVKRAKKANVKYNNRSLLSGLVGILRGTINGLIMFSFLGLLLLTISSLEPRDNENLSFKDERIQNIYDISKMTEKLGDTGLLKVLNKVKDKDNIPFYLFFANQIFSGETINYNGDKYTIYAAEQFGSFFGLARDLMDLFAKYDDNYNLTFEVINGESEESIEVLSQLFSDPNFNEELIKIIDKYQATEYLKNMTKITIATFGKYFDEIATKLAGEGATDIITMYDILFGNTDDPYYIAVEDIVTFEDSKTLLKGLVTSIPEVLDLLDYVNSPDKTTDGFANSMNYVNKSLKIVTTLEPHLKELSMFKVDEKVTMATTEDIKKTDRMNKLIDRLLEYNFSNIRDENGQAFEYPYKDANIKWNEELFNVTDAFSEVVLITNEMCREAESGTTSLEIISNVFAYDYEYAEDITMAYNSLAKSAGEFESVNILLEHELFYSLYESVLNKMVGSEVAIPHNLSWGNEGDVEGELTKSLKIFREVLGIRALDPILSETGFEDLNNVKQLLINLNKPIEEDGPTVLNAMMESNLLYYSTSIMLTNFKVDFIEITAPMSSYEKIEDVNMIKRSELVQLIDTFPVILDEIEDLNALKDDPLILVDVISKEAVKNEIIESNILASTFSVTLFNMLSTNESTANFIVVPSYLDFNQNDREEVLEKWIYANGEFDKMLSTLPLLDLDGLTSNDPNAIVDLIKMDRATFDILVNSDILYYSLSNIDNLISNDSFNIFVPTDATETGLEGTPIIKDELYQLLQSASFIISVNQETNELDFNLDAITENSDEILESKVLYATVASLLLDMTSDESEAAQFIAVPKTYREADLNFISNKDNVWNGELQPMIESFTILGIKISDLTEGNFDQDKLMSQVLTLDNPYEEGADLTKLGKMYESSILALTLSNMLITNEDINSFIKVPTNATEVLVKSEEDIIKVEEFEKLITTMKVSFGIKEDDNFLEQVKDYNKLMSNLFKVSDDSSDEEFIIKKNQLLSSLILEETLIIMINDQFAKVENESLVIPLFINDNNYDLWRTKDTVDGELGHLLFAFYKAGLGDAFASDNMNEIITEKMSLQNFVYTYQDSVQDEESHDSARLKEKEELQEAFINSNIFSATIINTLLNMQKDEEESFINIPYILKLENVKEQFNSESSWVKDEELIKVFKAINELKLNVEGNNILFDVNMMLTQSLDAKILCDSKVIHLTLSTQLLKQETLFFNKNTILSNEYDENYLDSLEFANILAAIKVLAGESDEFNISEIKISTIFNDDYEDNMNDILSSKTLEITLIKIITESFNSSSEVIIVPKELSYDFSILESNIINVEGTNLENYLYKKDYKDEDIRLNELQDIFDIVKQLDLASAIDNNEPIDISINSFVKNGNNDALVDANRKALFKSALFMTSITRILADSGLDLPTILSLDATQIVNKDLEYSSSTWNLNKEIEKLLLAFDTLGVEIAEDNSINFDINDYLNKLDNDSIDILYNSPIMYYTLSEKLINALVDQLEIPATVFVNDVNIYNEKVIAKDEFISLVDALKELNLDFENTTLVVPTTEQIKVLLDSEILKATLSKTILEQIKFYLTNDISTFTTYKKLELVDNKIIESNDYYQLSDDTLKAFLDALAVTSSGSKNFTITINSIDDLIALDETVINSSVGLSIINSYLDTQEFVKQALVQMIKQKDENFQLKSYEIYTITNDKSESNVREFFISQDLLKLK